MRKKINFIIEGMHCASCSSGIQKKLIKTKGIIDVQINLMTKSADVIFDDDIINTQKIYSLVDSMGFKSIKSDKFLYLDDKIGKEKTFVILSVVFTLFIFVFEIFSQFRIFNSVVSCEFFQFIWATLIQFVIGYSFYVNSFKALKSRILNMDILITIGTTSAYVYSVYGLFSNNDVYFSSSAMIITLVKLGRFLQEGAKQKATSSIKSLVKMYPKKAIRLNNGVEEEALIEELKIDDILVVKSGEKIPIDGIIIEGKSNVDESMISGESVPVYKFDGDVVIGGTINLEGYFKMRVTKVGENTMLSQIIKMVSEASSKKAPIEQITDRVSGVFVPIVLFLALLTVFFWFLITGDFSKAFFIGISVLVIACPCSLGLAVPTAMISAIGNCAKQGILIKNSDAFEMISKSNIFVFDKTGTITKGVPSITNVNNNFMDLRDFLYHVGIAEKVSEHPLGKAIYKYIVEKYDNIPYPDEVKNIPGEGIEAKYGNKVIYVGNCRKSDIKEFKKLSKEECINVAVYIDDELKGTISLADEIKTEAPVFINYLTTNKIKTVLLTGDKDKIAKSIGEEIAIGEVISEALPKDKYDIIDSYKKKYGTVVMVGDGINDAPALAYADVSIGMGKGTDIALENSDVVIVDGDLTKIVKLLELSKKTLKIIYENLGWAFVYNIIALPIAIFGYLSPGFSALAMSLSSISVVLNSLRLNKYK